MYYEAGLPEVRLISSLANPILTGSSLDLMCIVEWMVAPTTPVDVQVEWNGPSGIKALSVDKLVMKSPSKYLSKVVLGSIGLPHLGKYICTVRIGHQFTLVEKKTLTVGEHMFMTSQK